MTVCKTCKHANYCEIVAGGYSSQVKSCRDYRKGEPMTNEEYLKSCNTEQLAEILLAIYQDGIDDCKQEWWKDTKEDFVEWLKQPHKDAK